MTTQEQKYMTDGLEAAAKRYCDTSSLQAYIETKNFPAKPMPLPPGQMIEVKEEPKTFWDVETKRTAFGTGCLVMIISAAQGAFATVAPWVFGGLVVVYIVPSAIKVFCVGMSQCFTWESDKPPAPGNGGASGGGYQQNNYYQYNNFGANPNQQNGTK